MAALHERERTGRGQWIELAQVEALIPFVGEAIIDSQFTGKVPPARGNRHRAHAPHGIYKCSGENAWLALACESDADWCAAAEALGVAQLASDTRFACSGDRKANEAALDAELNRALAAIELDDAVRRLSEAGLLAAPVNPAPAVLADPQIAAREYFVAIDRAVVGTHLYPGAVARLTDTPLDASRPAPLLGEHNGEVFRRLLAMSDAEVATLENDGVIGTAPRQYRKAS
jgi:benzylsuccinate CoA-transferase BbsF subunit